MARRLLPLLLALLAPALGADTPFEALHRRAHPTFKVHAHRAPFPSDLVSALTLDRRGCLWAGTVAGLAKYDGRSWQVVPGPVPAWRLWVNNNALGTLEDGTLWCGTRTEGLLLFKDGRWTQIGKDQGLPTSAVNCLLESGAKDRGGRHILYVGTYGGGIARLADGKWETLDARHGLASNQVFCLVEDPWGRLWAGTSGGVSVLDGARFRPFEAQAELPDKEVRQLLWTKGADGAPILWLGPIRGGPCSWSKDKLTRHPIAAKGVSALIPSRSGGVWVSFWGDGLARWDGAHWETWTREDGLPSAQLRCLLEVEEDGRSVLWIGSDGRGVFRTAESGWRQFQPQWRGEVEVRAITEGPKGETWIAGRNFGLLRFDGQAWRQWELPARPIMGDIRCLAWWHDQLWAGCDLELAKLGPRGLEAGAPGTLLDRRIVRCLAASPDRLWVGTSIGLISWDGHRAEATHLPGGPGHGSVRSLAVVGGELWVGTDAGLLHWAGEGFTALPGLVPGEGILALRAVGPALWIGTSAGRILRAEGSTLEVLTGDGDRPAIEGLWIDVGRHRLVASTTRGVETWDLDRRTLLARDTMEDGLPDDTCMPGALFGDAQGRVWVGTASGLGVLDLAKAQGHPAPKPLHLEGALSAAGPREAGCLLPRGETWLEVNFALRAHHREEDSRYRTQLLPVEGAPGEWGAEGRRRLQSLPRGSYVLRVWGRDYQGQVSGPLDFPFQVTGRLWEHPLFLLFAGLVFFGVGAFFVRSRMAARERQLEAAVAEATADLSQQKAGLEELTRQQREIMGIVAHDVRNPLAGIGLMAEALEEEPDEAERRQGLQRVRQAVSSVAEMLNQFLTLQSIEGGAVELHLGPVELVPLLSRVLESFRPLAARKSQLLNLLPEAATVRADPKVLQEVVSNLISNALKYSPSGTAVQVQIALGSDAVRISVRDQGPGLTEADKARLFQRFTRLSARPTGGEHSVGLGLSICKRWMEAMGGRIGADSEPGKGATFWVELPTA